MTFVFSRMLTYFYRVDTVAERESLTHFTRMLTYFYRVDTVAERESLTHFR